MNVTMSPVSFTAVKVNTVNVTKSRFSKKNKVDIKEEVFDNLVISRDKKTGKVKLEEKDSLDNKKVKQTMLADHVDIPVVDSHSALWIKDDIKATIGKVFQDARVRILGDAKVNIGSISGSATLFLNDNSKADVTEAERRSWIYQHENSNLRIKDARDSHIILYSKDDTMPEEKYEGKKVASPTVWIRNLCKGSVLHVSDKAKATVITAVEDFTVSVERAAKAMIHFLQHNYTSKKNDPKGVIELSGKAELTSGGYLQAHDARIPITYMDKETRIIDEKGKDISAEFKPFRETEDEDASFHFYVAVNKNKELQKAKYKY